MNSEELINELNRIKELNQELYQSVVEPGYQRKVQEFLEDFEDYFRERGFVIRKKDHTVRVSFDTLHVKAFSEGRDIFIMRGKEQIASVTVKFSGEGKLGTQGQSLDSLDLLEKKLERETLVTADLRNPVFYYTGRDYGAKYETPLDVLESIFGI